MGYLSERTFDMSQFGWKGCTFTFKALTFGQQRDLDVLRAKWSNSKTKQELDEAAIKIFEIMKAQFVRGQALNEEGNKEDVKAEDLEKIPFDVFIKLESWITSGEVDEAFLAK